MSSDKITLTNVEKEIVKNAIPYIKKEEWDKAFYEITDAVKMGGNCILHILAFMKENGINLWHNITYIPKYTFWCCDELKEIAIPEGIINILSNAFDECVALQEVSIPESVTYIGYHVFFVCKALQEIKYAGTKE